MEPVSPAKEAREIKPPRANARRLTNESVFVTICSLTAFFIRLFLIPSDSVIGWDGVYYANLGEKIVSGNVYDGISAYWSPLYSFLIGIAGLFFQDSEFAGRFVSLVAGSLLVFPVFYLIRNFFGLVPAYIGTVLVIIHPGLIRSSMWVMTESLYTLVFTTGLLIAWFALTDGKTRDFFMSGVLFGAAYLLKPESIGFLGLIFVLFAASKLVNKHFSFRGTFKGYLLLLLGFSIFFLPYVCFLYQKTGHLTISQKLLNNLTAVDYGRGSLELTDDRQTTMKDRLFGDLYETEKLTAEDPPSATRNQTNSPPIYLRYGKLLSTTFSNLKILLKSYTLELFPYPVLFIFLIIIGFFYRPWTKQRTTKEIYLVSFVVSVYIGYAVTVIQVRYLYPVIPIFIAWTAHGIVQFSDWTTNSVCHFLQNKKKLDQRFIHVLTFLIISYALVFSIPSQMVLESRGSLPFEEKEAGLWIKNRSKDSVLIMAHSPIVAYYAGAALIFVPNEDFETVLEYATQKKVNYLVFSQRRFADTPKIFPESEKKLPECLKLVYFDEQSENNKIYIYQLPD